MLGVQHGRVAAGLQRAVHELHAVVRDAGQLLQRLLLLVERALLRIAHLVEPQHQLLAAGVDRVRQPAQRAQLGVTGRRRRRGPAGRALLDYGLRDLVHERLLLVRDELLPVADHLHGGAEQHALVAHLRQQRAYVGASLPNEFGPLADMLKSYT